MAATTTATATMSTSPKPPRPAAAFWSLIRPSTFALLLLTVSPLSILPHLPFAHLHTPLTLLSAVLALQCPHAPPARLHALLLFLQTLLLQHLPTLHPDPSVHAHLHSRLLSAATLAFLQHLSALALVTLIWALLLTLLLARLRTLPSDGLQPALLVPSLHTLFNGEMPARATLLLRDLPFALASAAAAPVMQAGYPALLVRAGGRVAHPAHVADVVAYGAAAAAGLALAKVLLPALWNAPGRRTLDAALRESATVAAWVVVTVATHVYVAVAVAERDVLGARCGVLKAVAGVFAVRVVLALVGAADRVVRERSPERRWAVDAVRVVVAAWVAQTGYERLRGALASEAVKNAVY